jgi:hypothetical protein
LTWTLGTADSSGERRAGVRGEVILSSRVVNIKSKVSSRRRREDATARVANTQPTISITGAV